MKAKVEVWIKNEWGSTVYTGKFNKVPTLKHLAKHLKKEKGITLPEDPKDFRGSIWVGIPTIITNFSRASYDEDSLTIG